MVADDRFGSAVAIDGDTVVIGAPLSDPDGLTSAGAAYVFVRDGGVWTQQGVLTASDKGAGDRFGEGITIDGDRIVVGAHREERPGGFDQGAAYTFVRDGTTWTEVVKLAVTGAGASEWFGRSVSMSGDCSPGETPCQGCALKSPTDPFPMLMSFPVLSTSMAKESAFQHCF
jgi:hypothetical protein